MEFALRFRIAIVELANFVRDEFDSMEMLERFGLRSNLMV